MSMTGGSKGIRRTIPIACSKIGAAAVGVAPRSGFLVLEKDLRHAARSAGRNEPKILMMKLYMDDRVTIEPAAEEVEADFDKMDLLVDNARYFESNASIVNRDPNYW